MEVAKEGLFSVIEGLRWQVYSEFEMTQMDQFDFYNGMKHTTENCILVRSIRKRLVVTCWYYAKCSMEI